MTTTTLPAYSARLLERLDTLVSHPDIVLVNRHVGAPLSDAELKRVEHKVGGPLSPSITAFFRQCNGLSFEWVHRDNPRYDLKAHAFHERNLGDGAMDAIFGDGAVAIPALESIVDRSWQGILYGEDWGLDEWTLKDRAGLRPFDLYSDYSFTSFDGFTEDYEDPTIVLIGQHGATCEVSRISFTVYMEELIRTYGWRERRRIRFSYDTERLEIPESVDAFVDALRKTWPEV